MLIKIKNSQKSTSKNETFLNENINQVFEVEKPVGDKINILGQNITINICNIQIIDDRGYFRDVLMECYQNLLIRKNRTKEENILASKLYNILR